MGQAKRRGSYEERMRAAQERNAAIKAELANREPTNPARLYAARHGIQRVWLAHQMATLAGRHPQVQTSEPTLP